MNQYYPDNVIEIPSATPEKTDAQQYLIRHGVKCYNACGHLSVARVLNYTNIDTFLDELELINRKLYVSLLPQGRCRTTGIYDLSAMLSTFGLQPPFLDFSKTKINPESVRGNLVDSKLILGVQIDHTGYLVGKGTPHWIVLEDVLPLRNVSQVAIYNPFTNSIEPYSWRELMTSTGVYKQGLWVKRS